MLGRAHGRSAPCPSAFARGWSTVWALRPRTQPRLSTRPPTSAISSGKPAACAGTITPFNRHCGSRAPRFLIPAAPRNTRKHRGERKHSGQMRCFARRAYADRPQPQRHQREHNWRWRACVCDPFIGAHCCRHVGMCVNVFEFIPLLSPVVPHFFCVPTTGGSNMFCMHTHFQHPRKHGKDFELGLLAMYTSMRTKWIRFVT